MLLIVKLKKESKTLIEDPIDFIKALNTKSIEEKLSCISEQLEWIKDGICKGDKEAIKAASIYNKEILPFTLEPNRIVTFTWLRKMIMTHEIFDSNTIYGNGRTILTYIVRMYNCSRECRNKNISEQYLQLLDRIISDEDYIINFNARDKQGHNVLSTLCDVVKPSDDIDELLLYRFVKLARLGVQPYIHQGFRKESFVLLAERFRDNVLESKAFKFLVAYSVSNSFEMKRIINS